MHGNDIQVPDGTLGSHLQTAAPEVATPWAVVVCDAGTSGWLEQVAG